MEGMNPSLYEAAATGDVGFLEKIVDGRPTVDLFQKTPQENNILHIAAEFKQINFIKEVKKHHESPQFWATNKNGETPLHVAARVGCEEVVTFLIDHTKWPPIEGVDSEEQPIDREAYKKLLRMTNLEMDTALHVAVRYHHAGVVKLLMTADPELCCSYYSIKESPLFLAVRAGSTSIANYILNDTPIHIFPSFQGTNGVTALHAAATRESFANKGIVQSMVDKNPGIIEEVDEIRWTPLHYASLTGNLKAAQLLIQKSNSACYIKDNFGMSALHVAAYAGHTQIIEELIRRCPDTCDLVNHNGQTALHAAVLGEKLNVVEYVLRTPKLARLINEADNDGNTPWHLAAIHENRKIVAIFGRDSRLNRTAINKELLQVNDILRTKNMRRKEIRNSFDVMKYLGRHIRNVVVKYLGRDIRNVVVKYLERDIVTGVPYFQQKITHEFKKFESQGDSVTSETPVNTTNTRENLQVYSDRAFKREDTKLLVATLIATVTFTAVTNVPGGFKDDGKPALKEKAAYKVFTFFNAVSFFLSVLAIYNESSPISVLSTHLPTPKSLINFSIAGIGIAFWAGGMALAQERGPGQSWAKYLLGDDFIIKVTLVFIGSVILVPLVVISIAKSLIQITRGIMIHDLQNHII